MLLCLVLAVLSFAGRIGFVYEHFVDGNLWTNELLSVSLWLGGRSRLLVVVGVLIRLTVIGQSVVGQL